MIVEQILLKLPILLKLLIVEPLILALKNPPLKIPA
jgi:hypothetical protein